MRRRLSFAVVSGLVACSVPTLCLPSQAAPVLGGELLSRPLAAAVITRYQEERVAGAVGLRRVGIPLSKERFAPALLTALATEKAAIAETHHRAGSDRAYDRGMVQVAVSSVTRDGDTATVTTKDSTRLHLRGAGIGPDDYATDVAPRSYTFRLVDGRWQVTGVKDLQELTPEQRRDAGAAAADILAPLPRAKTAAKRPFAGVTDSPEVTAQLKARSTANTLTAPYNRDKASDYAWRHVFFHNDEKYPTWGGADCTNFVSQVLTAGGWTNVGKGSMNAGDRRAWYYTGGSYPNTRNAATSLSWINAQKLADFFRANPQRVVEYRNPANARVGDIVQFRWGGQSRISHSAVVTGVMPWGLYLTYHSTDKLNESLNMIMMRDPGAQAYFFSPR